VLRSTCVRMRVVMVVPCDPRVEGDRDTTAGNRRPQGRAAVLVGLYLIPTGGSLSSET
jgi:hypothetical protein